MLTTKEKEVLRLLSEGQSYKMIAAGMVVSINTVQTHIRNIYSKLSVNSSTQAVRRALKEELV